MLGRFKYTASNSWPADISFSFKHFSLRYCIYWKCFDLIALRKESSLHPPSKVLLRSLATTDLCVGLIAEPLIAIFWMSLVNDHWSICRLVSAAVYITSIIIQLHFAEYK